ncbi:MAG TPA: hypothetical protein VGK94_12860 [Candidatus Polarisedimenticolia bacterium]
MRSDVPLIAISIVVVLSAGALHVSAQEPAPSQEPAVVQEDPRQRAIAYYQQGMGAYQRKDYIGYLDSLQKAVELDPDHPAIRYRLACASALVGNKDEALADLKRVIEMKVYQDLAGNTDFDSMRQTPEFQALAASMRAVRDPINHSTTAFHLTEKDLITEGIAYDPVEAEFFISSVHKRKILRSNRKGRTKDFTAPRQDGLGAVLGLKVDPVRRLLWACSTGMPQMEGATDEEKGRAALFKYDLKAGTFVRRYPLGAGMPGHNCNDLALGSGGDVYVSDSESGEILLLGAGAEDFVVLVEAGRLKSPQGIALSPDEKRAFVADYATTIFVVDLAARRADPLTAPAGIPLLGVDGLILHGGSLIAIQNGINPHRVTRLAMSSALDRIIGGTILEMNNPIFDEPTLGTIAGKELFYVGNSQWSRFAADGTIYPMNRLAEPVILKLKLD